MKNKLKALAFTLLALSFLIYPAYWVFCKTMQSSWATQKIERALGKSLGMEIRIYDLQCRGLVLHASRLEGFAPDTNLSRAIFQAGPIDCQFSFLKLIRLQLEINRCDIEEATLILPDKKDTLLWSTDSQSAESASTDVQKKRSIHWGIHIVKIHIERANLIWEKASEHEGGIYQTSLTILPSNPKEDNQQTDTPLITVISLKNGELRQKGWPALQIQEALLYLRDNQSVDISKADLFLKDELTEGNLKINGYAGLRARQPSELNIEITKLPIRPFLPSTFQNFISGQASGHAQLESSDRLELQNIRAYGHLTLNDGKLYALPGLGKLEKWIPTASYREIQLDRAEADWQWQNGVWHIQNIHLESNDQIQLTGETSIQNKQITGLLKMGVNEKIFSLLPETQKKTFTEHTPPYHYKYIQLSGSLESLQESISFTLQEAITNVIEEKAQQALEKAKSFFENVFEDIKKKASEVLTPPEVPPQTDP